VSTPIDGEQVSYDAGYDAGRDGPNTTNCHYSLFSSPERTRAWERGFEDGKAERTSNPRKEANEHNREANT
jgi:hypothetical protein